MQLLGKFSWVIYGVLLIVVPKLWIVVIRNFLILCRLHFIWSSRYSYLRIFLVYCLQPIMQTSFLFSLFIWCQHLLCLGKDCSSYYLQGRGFLLLISVLLLSSHRPIWQFGEQPTFMKCPWCFRGFICQGHELFEIGRTCADNAK